MNKVILIGNLTRDPELRTTQSGTTLCSFGLAVNRRRRKGRAEGPTSGEQFGAAGGSGNMPPRTHGQVATQAVGAGMEGQQEVDFFTITAWRQLGELCARYLSKGRKVCVVGQIQIRSYDAQDGTKRTAVDIVADDIEFLSSARDAGTENSGAAAPAKTAAGDYDTSGFAQADEEELPF